MKTKTLPIAYICVLGALVLAVLATSSVLA